jgi:hypothetical protein
MQVYRYDKDAGVLFMLAPDGGSTDAELARLYDAFLTLDADAAARGGVSLSFLVVTNPRLERPNASWRRQFAELRLKQRARRRVSVLVTGSAVLRGVMTVLNWLQPPPPAEEMGIFGNFEEGIRFAEARRGPCWALLYRFLDEACVELGLPHHSVA